MSAEGVPAGGRKSPHSNYTQDSSGAITPTSSTGNRQGTGMNVGRTVNRGSYASASSGGSKSSGSTLSFPGNLGTDPTQMNMMMFTPKEITGGSGDARTITFRKHPKASTIALPIPSGINESFQQSWSAATVSGKNAMWSDKAGTLLKAVAENTLPTTTAGIPGPVGRRKSVSQMVAGITGEIGREMEGVDVMGNISSGGWWDSVFGGVTSEMTAMVAASPLEGLATAAQYTTGMRAVQQSIMSYGGPGFRSFNYTFSLKPFSAAETETVQQIVSTFKEYSAPNQQDTRYTRVYDLPCVFKIQFYNGGQENKYIGHIGHCALSNFSVSYGGGKFTTFAGTHAPVQVDITLQFQEMELLNRGMMRIEEFGGPTWPSVETDSYGSTKIGNTSGAWT